MTKKPQLVFDNNIKNIEELIKQLESIKIDAERIMGLEPSYEKDFYALKITINFLNEIKGVQNEKTYNKRL